MLIEEKVAEQRAQEMAMRGEYDALKRKQEESLKTIKDIDSLNMVYESLKDYTNIWDSKNLWRKDIKQHADKLNAVFNQELKRFEKAA